MFPDDPGYDENHAAQLATFARIRDIEAQMMEMVTTTTAGIAEQVDIPPRFPQQQQL